MHMRDIEAGRSYACRFRTAELVDINGEPVVDKQSQTAASMRPREGFGIIKTRDEAQQLVEVIDTDSEKVYVVGWEDCWDIDEVEWHESN